MIHARYPPGSDMHYRDFSFVGTMTMQHLFKSPARFRADHGPQADCCPDADREPGVDHDLQPDPTFGSTGANAARSCAPPRSLAFARLAFARIGFAPLGSARSLAASKRTFVAGLGSIIRQAVFLMPFLLLAGCGDDMRLHTQTELELERSLERVIKRMSLQEAERFDKALQDIVVLGLDVEMPEAYRDARRKLAEFTGESIQRNAPAFVSAMLANVRERWHAERVRYLFDNAAPRLDRKTPEEIISLAEDVRVRAETVRAERWSKLEQDIETAYLDLRSRIDSVLSQERRDRDLRAIHIRDLVLMAREREDRIIPVVTFMLVNTGEFIPTELWLAIEAQDHGKVPLPLIMHYRIPGGLRPGSTQRHAATLSPVLDALFGSDYTLSGIELSIEPLAASDLRGRIVGPADIGDLTFERLEKLDELRGFINGAHYARSSEGT